MANEAQPNLITYYIIPLLVAVSGFIVSLSKWRVKKEKTVLQKSHEETLSEMPIFFFDRNLQAAQSEIKELHETVHRLELRQVELEAEIKMLKQKLSQ